MVTDAAGTGFEIKKPHKGTETSCPGLQFFFPCSYLKLRNPIRGRKPSRFTLIPLEDIVFEIKKPHKGTETQFTTTLIMLLFI